jgi:hypothetical protein
VPYALYAVTGVYADGGDTTLIHGCVAKDGTTRVVSPTTACKSNETATHWPTAARIVTDETRITNTENKNTTQDSAISAIQTKNNQQDSAIAALQGQGGGGSGLVVKDSSGQVVGKFVFQGFEAVLASSGTLIFNVSGSGFYPILHHVTVYTQPNCAGTSYMYSNLANEMSLVQVANFDGQIFRYPSLNGPYVTLNPASFNTNPDPSQSQECINQDPGYAPNVKFAVVQTLDVSTLGFVPPFRLE